jgi:hypothetical protein
MQIANKNGLFLDARHPARRRATGQAVKISLRVVLSVWKDLPK